MSFKDHFSALAGGYARHRPRYPRTLAAYLASIAPSRALALDLATGNGQAAVDLAAHFDLVIASDASERQLREACPHPRVAYLRHAAECLPLGPQSADLIAVAQAAHWFDFDRFYAEARRVLRPGGIVALWTYGLLRVDAGIDSIIDRFDGEVVRAWWPPERRYVDERYATLPFPLRERPAPAFEIVADLSLQDVVRYIGTWSAVDRYRTARGEDPCEELAASLGQLWRDGQPRRVCWPIYLRVGSG